LALARAAEGLVGEAEEAAAAAAVLAELEAAAVALGVLEVAAVALGVLETNSNSAMNERNKSAESAGSTTENGSSSRPPQVSSGRVRGSQILCGSRFRAQHCCVACLSVCLSVCLPPFLEPNTGTSVQ
jgi:hypothetical protein